MKCQNWETCGNRDREGDSIGCETHGCFESGISEYSPPVCSALVEMLKEFVEADEKALEELKEMNPNYTTPYEVQERLDRANLLLQNASGELPADERKNK